MIDTVETLATPDASPKTDRISISADDVALNTRHLPEDQQHLVRWLYSYAQDQRWGWNDCARASTISTSVLFKIWRDKYRDAAGERVSLESVCEKIARCKELVEKRGAAETSALIPYVDISIGRKCFKICDEARTLQTIAMIYGEPQIGKTHCLEHYTAKHNSGQTIMFRVPAASGVQAMLQAFARACHVSPKTCFDKLKIKICNFLDHTKLVVVDETHLFFETYHDRSVLKCLETLREIHDLKKCGMVFCGSNVWRDELQEGAFKKMLLQLRRRGILELQLPDVAPKGDVWAIAAHFKLPPLEKGEAYDLVKLIIHHDGLGKFTKLLLKTQMRAHAKKLRITWALFVETHTLITKLSVSGSGHWDAEETKAQRAQLLGN